MSTTSRFEAAVPSAGKLAQMLAGVWHGYSDLLYRRGVVRTLQSLDDRILKDIGISRGEIEAMVAEVTAERRRASYMRSGPAFSSKSPSSHHVALKQRGRASAISEVQGERCSS